MKFSLCFPPPPTLPLLPTLPPPSSGGIGIGGMTEVNGNMNLGIRSSQGAHVGGQGYGPGGGAGMYTLLFL